MPALKPVEVFHSQVASSLTAKSFVKISLGNYKGQEQDLKQILARQVVIKRQDKLSLTFRYKTRDVVKNFDLTAGQELLMDYLHNGFKIATLFTTDRDVIFEELNNGKTSLRELPASVKETSAGQHDQQKIRLVHPADKNYLKALKITDSNGSVYKNAQDKFRQINHYIEILSTLIKEVPADSIKKVADMGAGKGYLTFALYDYLHSTLNLDVEVMGIEYRQDLVDLCNTIAKQSSFHQLQFIPGTIQDFDAKDINLLIALHACDTATDDAIFKGIQAQSELIVVAPCCHKQIRKEMEKNKARNEVSFLTRYGIFLERQAEMVTDGIRALILEYFGYKTKIVEFISDAHTPKNVLVIGIKGKAHNQERKEEILQKIKETKAYFGISFHHLERLLNL